MNTYPILSDWQKRAYQITAQESAGQCMERYAKTGQGRAGQERAGQGRVGQGRAWQSKPWHGMAGQGWAR